MNTSARIAEEIVEQARKYHPSQEIYRELMAAAGQFAIAAAIIEAAKK